MLGAGTTIRLIVLEVIVVKLNLLNTFKYLPLFSCFPFHSTVERMWTGGERRCAQLEGKITSNNDAGHVVCVNNNNIISKIDSHSR